MNLKNSIKQILTRISGEPKIPFWSPVWVWADVADEDPVLAVIVPKVDQAPCYYHIKELSACYAKGMFIGWSWEVHPDPCFQLYAWELLKRPAVRCRVINPNHRPLLLEDIVRMS